MNKVINKRLNLLGTVIHTKVKPFGTFGNKIIIANWKNNPSTLEEAQGLFQAETAIAEQYPNIQTIICPPPVFLKELSKVDSGHLGAQDIENFAEMLKNLGVSHVLVGHSDRRYGLGETDELINKKIKFVLAVGIAPVLLVGEKEKGESRESVLAEQLDKDLAHLSVEQISKILFTYEPVWAISTKPGGQADTPESALEVVRFIREFLAINYKLQAANCLYGGSVKEKNVVNFLQHPEINGAVIGGASLNAKEFANILKITASIKSR